MKELKPAITGIAEAASKKENILIHCAEFVGSPFQEVLAHFDTAHHPVMAGEPESNGAVERQMRTSFEGCRASLFDLGLPASYWAFAVAHQAYVRNRVPRMRLAAGRPAGLARRR